MTVMSCKHYDRCNAQLCPMSIEQESNCIWYPDEDICKIQEKSPKWVDKQRKIKAKAKEENLGFYFTIDMLSSPFRVTKNVKGLDPDLKEEPQLKAWKKLHVKGKRGSA